MFATNGTWLLKKVVKINFFFDKILLTLYDQIVTLIVFSQNKPKKEKEIMENFINDNEQEFEYINDLSTPNLSNPSSSPFVNSNPSSSPFVNFANSSPSSSPLEFVNSPFPNPFVNSNAFNIDMLLTKDDYAHLFWICCDIIEKSSEKLKESDVKESQALTEFYKDKVEIFTKMKRKLEGLINVS